MGDDFETPLKGMTENNTLRGLSPRVEDESELEEVVKSQGMQIANMQDSLSQILQLLKTREETAEGSKGKTREDKQKAVLVLDSPARTEGGGPDAEETDLGFLEEHLRSTYGKHKSPNVLQNPLSRELFKTPVPPNFSSMGLPTYSGTSDPADHLCAFMLKMQLINASDSDLCKAFPVTFSGQCRTWYTSLPEGIIENFEQFAMLFSTKFASQRRRKLTVSSLINCRQKKEESLAEFYDRWNAITCEIDGISSVVAAGNLRISTTSIELKRTLIKKEAALTSWSELDQLARRAILLEEALATEDRSQSGRQQGDHQERGDTRRGRRSPDRRPYRNRYSDREGKKEVLSTDRERGRDRRRGGRKQEIPSGQEPQEGKKWCDWHQIMTHDTTECREFKASLRYLAPGDLRSRLETRRSHRGNSQEAREDSHSPDLEKARRTRKERSRSPARNKIGSPQRQSPTYRPQRNDDDGMEVITIVGGRKRPRTEGDRIAQCLNVQAKATTDVTFLPSELAKEENSEDPLVISFRTAKFKVTRALVDNRSSADILFYSALKGMKKSVQDLSPSNTSLVGFSGTKVRVLGSIILKVTIGEEGITKTKPIEFHVADCPSAYNAILGRGFLASFEAVASTCHQMLKFPSGGQMGRVRGNAKEAKECYQATVEHLEIDLIDSRGDVPHPEAVEGDIAVALDEGRPERTVRISSHLAVEEAHKLLTLLREFEDLFAWGPEDMPGVPRHVSEHHLSVKQKMRPIQQRRRHLSVEKQMALEEEIRRLLKAGFIKEVKYPTWLSNPVFVRKAGGAWRMCIDFPSLNAACTKDSYPLPRIDQLIDGTTNHEALSFLDIFSGYHQIRMAESDQEYTAFMTPMGNFCYVVMPFGLKNAGATYQRMVDAVFTNQMGRNVEAYVDDVLVKSRKAGDHLTNLRETFETLRRRNLRLNPLKCVFGAEAGKFLGFMITNRGIEANPKQIEAIRSLKPPKTIKEIQAFNGKMAALGQFIPRSADKCSPFFQMLKKTASKLQWNEECDKAFALLTNQLSSPPVLSAPIRGERLYLYLAVSEQAVSSALVRRAQDGSDQPVYYVSKALLPAETRYLPVEKAVLAVTSAARKLRPYFQEHPITVLAHLPLKSIMRGMDASGRLTKWAIELSEYDIEYAPRPAIKGQVLADFIAERFSLDTSPSEDRPQVWRLFIDGAAGKTALGAGIVIESPEGVVHEISLRFKDIKTNNAAEYEALINGLRILSNMGASDVHIFSDSLLVVKQVHKAFEIKDEKLAVLANRVRSALGQLNTWKLDHVRRDDNQ
ncbi:unnamed protein product [Linum trigynum]|uniref:RNase H type-1 domain-containing protein n=1 Tax=Linum trigynum TaxID=586398 RepID=A0AAV2GRT4_9ROSI